MSHSSEAVTVTELRNEAGTTAGSSQKTVELELLQTLACKEEDRKC